jgi:hypothetical protein
MAEQSSQLEPPEGEVARDELEVRIFTLADHVAGPPDGKLYINGAGVDTLNLPQIPGAINVPLGLAVRIRIPWRMTSDTLPFQLQILDADRNPVGPGTLLEGNAEIGRAPGQRPGDESGINIALTLTGFPIEQEGTVYFHLRAGGQLLGVLPLKIRQVQIAQPAPRRGSG